MERITESFEHGQVTWRLPNIIEETRILGKLGLSMTGKVKDTNDFVITANAMEAVGGLVEEISVKIGEEKIDSWERLIELQEFAGTLAGMGAKLLDHVFKAAKKKVAAQTAAGAKTSPAPSPKKKRP